MTARGLRSLPLVPLATAFTTPPIGSLRFEFGRSLLLSPSLSLSYRRVPFFFSYFFTFADNDLYTIPTLKSSPFSSSPPFPLDSFCYAQSERKISRLRSYNTRSVSKWSEEEEVAAAARRQWQSRVRLGACLSLTFAFRSEAIKRRQFRSIQFPWFYVSNLNWINIIWFNLKKRLNSTTDGYQSRSVDRRLIVSSPAEQGLLFPHCRRKNKKEDYKVFVLLLRLSYTRLSISGALNRPRLRARAVRWDGAKQITRGYECVKAATFDRVSTLHISAAARASEH